jgi:hypothetical protein
MIYWDVDGVLRDLAIAVFGKQPPIWDYVSPETGKTLIQVVNKRLPLLYEAPPTPYLSVARLYEPIKILSTQPPAWRPYTMHWLRQYILADKIEFLDYKDNKLKYLKDGDWLVEDSPNLEDYQRVILIDKPYNQSVNAPYRVKTPKKLKEILEKITGGKK